MPDQLAGNGGRWEVGYPNEECVWLRVLYKLFCRNDRFFTKSNSPLISTSRYDYYAAKISFIEAHCNDLPCPGYNNGKELTCVVCIN